MIFRENRKRAGGRGGGGENTFSEYHLESFSLASTSIDLQRCANGVVVQVELGLGEGVELVHVVFHGVLENQGSHLGVSRLE